MFRERGRNTATNRPSRQNRKRSFCRPVDRWAQLTRMSRKPFANRRQYNTATCTRLTTTTLRVLDRERLTALKQWHVHFIPTPSNEPGHASQNSDLVCAAWGRAAACHYLDVVARK